MPTGVGPRWGAVTAGSIFRFHGGCSRMENLRQLSGRHRHTLSGTHYPALDVALWAKQDKDKNQWSWMCKSIICYSNGISLLSYNDKQQKQIKLQGICYVGYTTWPTSASAKYSDISQGQMTSVRTLCVFSFTSSSPALRLFIQQWWCRDC